MRAKPRLRLVTLIKALKKMMLAKRPTQRNSKARGNDVTHSKQRLWPKRKIMRLSECDT